MPTILVVDDEKEIRDMLFLMLENAGYSCLKAIDGTQALEKLDEAKGLVNLVLLDYSMFPMNGGEFLEQLQKTDYATTPVVGLSSFGESKWENYVQAGQMSEYIIKPGSSKDIVNCVMRNTLSLSGSLDSQDSLPPRT